jgi:glucose/mannose-6-phosphate isomerase
MLDNQSKIAQLDSKNMRGSIESFGKQIESVWKEAETVKLPASYKKVKNIVVLGMGGSALGSHVIQVLFRNTLKVPLEIIGHYHVPATVTKDSLVIASSYSGTTEEIISSAKEALKKKAKIVVLTAGGVLAEWAKQHKLPVLVFSTGDNPCGSPRMGQGYMIFGQVALFSRLGLIPKITLKKILETISRQQLSFGITVPTEKNQAKQFAQKLLDKTVWYVASEHLSGNAHVAANQLNENAKRFGGYFIVPEMNHHLLEGMVFPESNKNNLAFVLLESNLYDKRVQKRYEITRNILEKNNIARLSYVCLEKDLILQACELLVFTAYVSFYSAMLQGIDPTAIPVVDFFKAQLKK